MLSHETVWSAIDLLARRNGLTPSGLARQAGLDPTTFNPSKRTAADGRPRWPSMESIAKIIGATINGVTINDQQPITVVAAAPNIAHSSLEVAPTQVVVNGTAVATVTARDAFDNIVSGADVTVSITNGGPSSGQTTGGVFTANVTAGTVGTQTVSATIEGAPLASGYEE